MSRSHAPLWATPLAAVLVVATLSGCGLFGRGKSDAYRQSRESRPLEVPPDLDAPSTSGALVIPEVSSAGADASGEVPAIDGAPSPPDAGTTDVGTESTLSLRDDVPGAYRRVGLALERGEVGEVVARDDTAGTYTVKTTVTERESGFFSRMFGREKVEVGEATRVVHVVAAGSGSTVQIEDESGAVIDDAAARKIISAIKRRLG